LVDQFSSFSVITFGIVVPCTILSEDEIVRAEELANLATSDGVHHARFEINKDCSRYVSATVTLVIVDVDSF
jgi:hypothetical protein